MELEEERRKFVAEVWRRFEEVQNWAIANWPDKDHPLTTSDFVEGRKIGLDQLGCRTNAADRLRRRGSAVRVGIVLQQKSMHSLAGQSDGRRRPDPAGCTSHQRGLTTEFVVHDSV